VEYAQTGEAPLIWAADFALTFTAIVTVESHPRLLTSVSDIVPAPAVFQFTLMLLPVVEPEICPPVTDHVTELPETVCKEYTADVYWHKAAGPVITGTGVGLMVMLRLTVESHPEPLVAMRVIVPAGPAFHRIETAVPVLVVMVPPVTVQVYEVFAVTGVE
jgi:hypothetical protein